MLAGPVCVLGEDRRLTLWVQAPIAAAITVKADRRAVTVLERQHAGAGTRLHVDLGRRRAERLSVTVSQPGQASSRWSLKLATETDPSDITRARALMRRGENEAARKVLRTALDMPAVARRGTMLGLLARTYLRQEDRPAAYALLQDAVAANLSAGRIGEALRDTNVIAYLMINEYRRLADVPGLYEGFQVSLAEAAEAWFFSAYYQGWAAQDAGDSRHAIDQLIRAGDVARAMGWDRRRLDADQALAYELANIGRMAEARQTLAHWQQVGLPSSIEPCEQAAFRTALGWASLLALEAGLTTDDPVPVLEEAKRRYDEAGCAVNRRVNARINLALANYHASRLDTAEGLLTEALALTESPELRLELWALDLGARLALARGDLSHAVRELDALARLAALTASPSAVWRAAVGRARLLAQRGDSQAAIAAYERADAQLERDLRRVPFHQGPELLLAARTAALDEHLVLLLDSGRYADALALVQRARMRLLQPFAAAPPADPAVEVLRAEYRRMRRELEQALIAGRRLPRDERERRQALLLQRERELLARIDTLIAPPGETRLATLPEGDGLLLAFHRLPQGWVTFAARAGEVTVRESACDPAASEADISDCLVAATADLIRSASSLELFAPPGSAGADFHAVQIDGRPVADFLPVTYRYELPPTRLRQQTRDAVLVGDPRNDLPAARVEVDAVARQLSATGLWGMDILLGETANAPALVQRLEHTPLFHYAGHARFAGERGWESALRLGGRTTLRVTDILTLRQAPALVVLSGCETGRSAESTVGATIGLAQAFLARGSRHVVATSRPVRDATALAVMGEFYARFTAGQPVAASLQGAQRAIRRADPAADWAAFRVIAR